MIGGARVLALIPARGGSRGLARKNTLPLGGVPLLGWPIRAARDSCYVDRIIVSTDVPEFAARAVELGAEAPFLRPVELASDSATTFSVIRHAVQFLATVVSQTYDYLVLLEPTSPLTEAEDIDRALEELVSKRLVADSIVGVSRAISTHPDYNVLVKGNGLITPYVLSDFSQLRRRQELSEAFFFEGSLYISAVNALLEKAGFYHDRTLAYVVPKWKSFEIDDLVDFVCVEAILKHRDELRNEQVSRPR